MRNLERVPGTAVLRMLRRPRSAAEAEAQRRALLGDPAVLPSTKQRIEEAIMEQRIRTDKHENETWAQYYQRVGRNEGRREALLRAAQLAADEATVKELEAISDVDELERTVHALLTARLRHGDGH